MEGLKHTKYCMIHKRSIGHETDTVKQKKILDGDTE